MFEAVIGLEVHAQLKTKTKAFCGCSTEFGAQPNQHICAICLGHPGTLPTLNQKLVDFAVAMGLATNCSIRAHSRFSRKNYFYPDLPKGYQISQYEDPICFNGTIPIELEDGSLKNIGITRIHMEEDSGKSIHDLSIDTLIDLNRAGVPLIEIVSEPDIRTGAEAYAYLQQIRQIVMYLGICDGNLEEGSLRCDANVSIRPIGQKEFGTKTEIKNLNSFRNVEKAIAYEIQRQTEVLQSGGIIQQVTMLWDASEQRTKVMRTKEQAHDYRYFPEPDLVPVVIDEEFKQNIQNGLPELPLAKKYRFVKNYELPLYDAAILTDSQDVADFYEATCKELATQTKERWKLVSNWIMTDILRIISEERIRIHQLQIKPQQLAELVDLLADDVINSKIAKQIFPQLFLGNSAKEIVEKEGLAQVSDTSLIERLVSEIVDNNPDSVQQYKNGKTKLFGFFVGQVLKETQGQANPKVINDILRKKLEEV